MPYFVGLDVSKNATSICVVDADGVRVKECSVETAPRTIAAALRGARRRYSRIGMEASDMAAWLSAGLAGAGLSVIPIDPRHTHAVLSTRHNKTDRNDAAGIAELMRIGTYKVAHTRSAKAREIRAILVARDTLVAKRRDIESVVRAILRLAGLKIPVGAARSFTPRVSALARFSGALAAAVEPLMRVRETLVAECEKFDALVRETAGRDAVCRRLQTAPGIGALAALAYRAAVDDPARFATSRQVAAHLGLTPRTSQSGERRSVGHIRHSGDSLARKLLFLAACMLTMPGRRASWLGRWAVELRERMPFKKAMVAVARKLAVVLHRMWVSETDFLWERAA